MKTATVPWLSKPPRESGGSSFRSRCQRAFHLTRRSIDSTHLAYWRSALMSWHRCTVSPLRPNWLEPRLADMLPRSDPRNLAFLQEFISTVYRLTAESHEIGKDGSDRFF